MSMLEVISQHVCREYPVKCPACGTDNMFPRLQRDIFRAPQTEPDGHPTETRWRADVEFPKWLTPLNYFWSVCQNCYFTGQIDDTEFRTWKKIERKYRSQFHENALETFSDWASNKRGIPRLLGASIPPDDIFGTQLVQFYLGIFTECQKVDPVPGTLARSYLRIAWIYRDETALYDEFAPSSKVRDLLEKANAEWMKAIPPNNDMPMVPHLATDELSALRFALSYFEWNYRELQSNAHEDVLRLMMLIAEIGYRIYELSGLGEDFTKGQSFFSGTMQKSMTIINDKSIVGGAVNRAKDTLEKAGERGRELRTLQKKLEKAPPEQRAAKPTAKQEAAPQPKPKSKTEAPQEDKKAAKPSVFDLPSGNVKELQERIAQLDAENKRWMRLAGFSEVTGLPNKVMLSRVFLPGALRQAVQKRDAIGCIFLAPQGLEEINSKYGRPQGDSVLRQFAESLKDLLKKDERLCHLDSVNFAFLVSGMTANQLTRRAEAIHKDLTSRRFEFGSGGALSFKISIGVAVLPNPNGKSAKTMLDDLYTRSMQALDQAKIQGDHIQVAE